jgi:hypothetical protein
MIPHKKSTETAIHDSLESAQKAIEKKDKTWLQVPPIYQNHMMPLLHKLDTYNIRGVANLLFKSYLSDWKQCNNYQ